MSMQGTVGTPSAPPISFRSRDSLIWRLLLPAPLVLILAVGVIWYFVPRVVAGMATNDAVIANQQIASQFKAMRGYYTEWVVKKAVESMAQASRWKSSSLRSLRSGKG